MINNINMIELLVKKTEIMSADDEAWFIRRRVPVSNPKSQSQTLVETAKTFNRVLADGRLPEFVKNAPFWHMIKMIDPTQTHFGSCSTNDQDIIIQRIKI
jgi:hypothetical protein